jgi:hypothetical protein
MEIELIIPARKNNRRATHQMDASCGATGAVDH